MERTTIDAGGAVSIIDHGGSGQLIVMVHGLEGSAYNWSLTAPSLAEHHRVVAPDLSGFGYTAPLDGGSSVERNTQLVADVIKAYGGSAVLVGNSMGGLISLLVADQFPELVDAIVLVDTAAPVMEWSSIRAGTAAKLSVPLLPWVGPKLVEQYRASQTVEKGVDEALHFVTEDADSLDPRVWSAAEEIAGLRRTQPWSTDALIQAANSIAPYVLRRALFTQMLHRISQPTLLVHGTNDALIQIQSAAWIANERPDWTVAYFENTGHMPMLETPEQLLEVIDVWEQAVLAPA